MRSYHSWEARDMGDTLSDEVLATKQGAASDVPEVCFVALHFHKALLCSLHCSSLNTIVFFFVFFAPSFPPTFGRYLQLVSYW